MEAWGPLLSNPYAPSIYKAFILCNQYGLEEIECGQLIALATEWYQMGLVTKEDTEGIELGWGNYEGALAMIPKIANSMTVAAMADIFSLTTGVQVDEAGMREIADRIGTLERAFIVREGITREDDFLVGRYMDGPVHGGPLDGLAFDRRKWNEMLDEYYSLLGWEIETGVPTRKTLERLGLAEVADDLDRRGKLRPSDPDR